MTDDAWSALALRTHLRQLARAVRDNDPRARAIADAALCGVREPAPTISRKIVTPTFALTGNKFELTEQRSKLLTACTEAALAVRFDATALPIQELKYTAGHDGIRLDAVIVVPDRDGNDVSWLITRTAIQPWEVLEANGPEYMVRWTADLLCGLMAHEVYESLRYHGVLIIDQHAPLLPQYEAREKRLAEFGLEAPPRCKHCGRPWHDAGHAGHHEYEPREDAP